MKLNKKITVITSDGRISDFNDEYIKKQIKRDSLSANKELSEEKIHYLVEKVKYQLRLLDDVQLTGSLIRGVVNNILIKEGYVDIYRMSQTVGLPTSDLLNIVEGFGVKDNANTDMLIPEAQHFRIASITAKQAMLNYLPQKLANLHIKGDIYIHDGDRFLESSFCRTIDLRYFYYYGLYVDGTGRSIPVAGPPKNAEVAILHAAKVLGAAGAHFAGGVEFNFFNTFISPYLKNKSYEDIYQLMQMFVFELSQMMVRGQPVFSSIQIHPGCPNLWKDRPAVYKGKISEEETYGKFEREIRLSFKALCDLYKKGDALGRPFSFPKIDVTVLPEHLEKDNEYYLEYGTKYIGFGEYHPGPREVTKEEYSRYLDYEKAIENDEFTWGSLFVEKVPSYNELWLNVFELTAKNGSPYFENQLNANPNEVTCYNCCHPSYTNVFIKTDKGIKIIPIEDLKEDDIIVTPEGTFSKFEGIYKKPFDDNLLRFKCQNGLILDVTRDHQLPIIRNDELIKVDAKDVTLEDNLLINRCLPTLETSLTSELAYMMGVFLGDGYARETRPKSYYVEFTFNKEHKAVLDKVRRIIKDNFNLEGSIKEEQKFGVYRLRYYRKSLYMFLKDSGLFRGSKTQSWTKEIPEEIFVSDPKIKFAFLYGYIDADGHLRENPRFRLQICTSSEKIAHGFMTITNSLGYNFHINDVSPCKETKHPSKLITLNLQEEIGSFFDGTYPYNGYSSLKIVSIEKIPYKGIIYDPINVNGHNFISDFGLCSGNCAFKLGTSLDNDEMQDILNFKGGAHFNNLGSHQVVTINLPRLIYNLILTENIQKKDFGNCLPFEDNFKLLSNDLVDDIIKIFKLKYDIVRNRALPFARQTPIDPNDNSKHAPPLYIDENTPMCVAFVGLNEAVQAYTGFQIHEKEESWLFGLRLLTMIKETLSKKQKGLEFPLAFARAPAETTAGRLARLDVFDPNKEISYLARKVVKGDLQKALKNPEEADQPIYYTNGAMVADGADVDILTKIKLEDPAFCIVDGGDMLHIWLGEKETSPKALMDFALNLFKNTNIDYCAFTKDFSMCETCKTLLPGLKDKCSNCGSENLTQYTRVTGYFQAVNNFGEAKKEEVIRRIHYDLP